jgi:uncharacterized protein
MSTKAVPEPTPETAPYWEATRRGELCLPYCAACDAHWFYPRPFCPTCHSSHLEWRVVSGRATLWSYVIAHRPAPGFEDQVPYAIALVRLAEGPTMMTNIVGVENTPEHLILDMDLEVAFEARGDEQVPVFTPARTQP